MFALAACLFLHSAQSVVPVESTYVLTTALYASASLDGKTGRMLAGGGQTLVWRIGHAPEDTKPGMLQREDGFGLPIPAPRGAFYFCRSGALYRLVNRTAKRLFANRLLGQGVWSGAVTGGKVILAGEDGVVVADLKRRLVRTVDRRPVEACAFDRSAGRFHYLLENGWLWSVSARSGDRPRSTKRRLDRVYWLSAAGGLLAWQSADAHWAVAKSATGRIIRAGTASYQRYNGIAQLLGRTGLVAVPDGPGVVVYRIVDGKRIGQFDTDAIETMAYSEPGRHLIVGEHPGAISVWRVLPPKRRRAPRLLQSQVR